MRRACLPTAVAGLAAFAIALAAAEDPGTDPLTALADGNRLFRDGRIEAAAGAYLAGYAPSAPHPTLAYNLGTALHHLGRLPEAVLWYRRAGDADDPWLADNLRLARGSLGGRILPPGGALGWLRRHAEAASWSAVALAWLTLLAVLARPAGRAGAAAAIAAAVVAAVLYAGGAIACRWGPQPAVILEDCSSGDAELPAGSEVWVVPAAGAPAAGAQASGGWSISGLPGVWCPSGSLELVFPRVGFAAGGGF